MTEAEMTLKHMNKFPSKCICLKKFGGWGTCLAESAWCVEHDSGEKGRYLSKCTPFQRLFGDSIHWLQWPLPKKLGTTSWKWFDSLSLFRPNIQ